MQSRVSTAVRAQMASLIGLCVIGGHVRQPGRPVRYGHWDASAIFPIWGIAGIFYGIVELIRRVM